ncbi:MAG TPA: hypothetical protein IAC19_03355 [Candidatus Ventricola gallistercoris]|nr:hypothetical protein [Candidatus Ventricola gallistercoris]
MFALIYLLYLFLCLPLTVRAGVGINGVQSSVRASVSMLMVEAHFDGVIEHGGGAALPHVIPRYAQMPKQKGSVRERLRMARVAKPYLRAAMEAAQWQQLEIDMRVGLEEAWETAVAAGAARALVFSALSGLGCVPPCDLRIEPDFRAPCLVLNARCIFFVRAGDIMLAVIRNAVKKTQKEGLKWSSIPSRA